MIDKVSMLVQCSKSKQSIFHDQNFESVMVDRILNSLGLKFCLRIKLDTFVITAYI